MHRQDLFEALMVVCWWRSAKCHIISSSCGNSPAVVGVLCISECVCRLIAQLHDELLYEVEDSQVQQFAGEFTTSNIKYFTCIKDTKVPITQVQLKSTPLI